jgi:hypothetical protein
MMSQFRCTVMMQPEEASERARVLRNILALLYGTAIGIFSTTVISYDNFVCEIFQQNEILIILLNIIISKPARD